MARRDDLLWEVPHRNPATIGDEARTPMQPTPVESLIRSQVRLLAILLEDDRRARRTARREALA